MAAISGMGDLVQELLGTVLERMGRSGKFELALEQLLRTLESLGPDINEVVRVRRKLDQSQLETMRLVELMQSGKDLVLMCSKLRFKWWNSCYKMAYYQQKLEELDASILRYFQVDPMTQIARTMLDIEVKVEPVSEHVRPVLKRGMCRAPKPSGNIIGLDVPLKELKLMLLHEEEGSVSVLAVVGYGGLGKTTLAITLCWEDEVRGKFKENIFFVTLGQRPKLNNIVQELFQHTGYPVPEFQSDEDAINKLENLFKEIGKKCPILLVLDDVWLEQSKSPVDDFMFQIPNYKILVTSRSPEITRFSSLLVLKPLGEEDATNLFRHSAFLNQSSSNIPNDIVKQVVRGCRGSPLALNHTARSLRDQNLEAWLKRVKDFFMECYKDLSLFPKDHKIRVAALVGLWAELHSEDDDTAMKRIDELVDGSLAKIVVTRKVANDIVGYNYNYVVQPDGVREAGFSQNSLEPEIENQRTRLIIEINGNNLPPWWSVEKENSIAARILSISTDEAFSSKWCNLEPTEVEVLVLNLRQKKYTLPMFMMKMEKLKVLTIINYDSYRAEFENFELLGHLPNLRRLWLENVSVPFLSDIILHNTRVQFRNLQKCYFFMCNVNKVFSYYTDQVSDVLPNLVEMDFDYCTMEELPVVLSNCILLKKLRITNCHLLSTLPEGIGNLVNLELLSLSSCSDLVKLPDSIKSLESLKFLDISNCISLTKLPEDMGKLSNLEKLNVRGCSRLTVLPASIKNLGNLKDVVCDQKMAGQFKQRRSDLHLHTAQAHFNLNFLNKLSS